MATGALAMASAALGRVSATATEHASADDYVLWFNEPATLWQEHAFPVGNGSTGAMIYGTVGATAPTRRSVTCSSTAPPRPVR